MENVYTAASWASRLVVIC